MVVLRGWAFSYERGTPIGEGGQGGTEPERFGQTLGYRSASLIRNRPLRPYCRPIHMALWWSWEEEGRGAPSQKGRPHARSPVGILDTIGFNFVPIQIQLVSILYRFRYNGL